MAQRFALTGADIFTGEKRLSGHALLIASGSIEAVVPEAALPAGIERHALGGGLLAPGFVDLQVNGGGGVLLNEQPTVAGVAAICAAHRRFGSTALLPTVITDRSEVTSAAIEAVEAAMAAHIPGCLGIHVEGPFIDVARKGAHDPALIRRMAEEDLAALAATRVRPFLLTVAPESVSTAQIARLRSAGIHVSLGHSDTDYETANAAFAAGASLVTHLFNAMSQLGHRRPGLVGAALDRPDVWCGIIPDGHHVHPAALGAALRGKAGPGRVFAVSDAMPTVGIAEDTFMLNGRLVRREAGRLTLDDGTLAGSDLSMIGAARYLTKTIGLELEEALRMVSLYPAKALGLEEKYGRLASGSRADLVHLSDTLNVEAVWIAGERLV